MEATKQLNQDFSPEMFQPGEVRPEERNGLSGKHVGYWTDVWRRFRSNKGAIIGFAILLIIGFLALFGQHFVPYDYQTQNYSIQNKEPFGNHYFGTDNFGRDLWARTWYGAGISLTIAFLAVFIDMTIGVTFGAISGYFGGKVDTFMQRILEVMYCIPQLIILILIMLYFQPGIVPIGIAMGITQWVPMARIVRAQVMRLKEQEFVLAARTLGASHRRLLIKHLLPNVMGPIIVSVTFDIPQAIFFEAFLSFIGLGINPPQASLGMLVSDGFKNLQLFPYQVFYPGLVLCLIMLSFNLLGDGLRDALDPKLRR